MREITFTEAQRKKHRDAFIEECRAKAWGASCHADWVAKGLDELLAEYKKLQEQDKALETESEALKNALDNHTVENRNKRKGIQEKRDQVAAQLKAIAANAQTGQKALEQLYQSIETSLALAKHAEGWEWKEVESQTKEAAN